MKLHEIKDEWPTMVIRLALKVLAANKEIYLALDKTDGEFFVYGQITSIEVTPQRVSIWYVSLSDRVPSGYHIWENNEQHWLRLQVGTIKNVVYNGKQYYSLLLPSDIKLEQLWDEKTRSSK